MLVRAHNIEISFFMKQQTLARAADPSESFERYRRLTQRDEFLAPFRGPGCAR